MTKWVWKGLATGIKTSSYPRDNETSPGISPGRPGSLAEKVQGLTPLSVRVCPTGALRAQGKDIAVSHARCIHCFRCKRQNPQSVSWEETFEWSETTGEGKDLGGPFAKSLHIRIVDAGACGACMSEIKQLNNPYYNIHRLGFFITPTPRNADVLLVAGPGTDHMRLPLKKAFEAMPGPKRVLAIGTCALSGGIFGPSFAAGAGVSDVVPVDVKVPGCPPPPLAIIHALLVTAGRKQPIGTSSPGVAEKKGEMS